MWLRASTSLGMASARATEMPPRMPPQVRILMTPGVNSLFLPRSDTAPADERNLTARVTGMSMMPAMMTGVEKSSMNISSPMSRNSMALSISSMSSQKVSTFERVFSLIAFSRAWFPIMSPATTMASGPLRWQDMARRYPAVTSARVSRTSTW